MGKIYVCGAADKDAAAAYGAWLMGRLPQGCVLTSAGPHLYVTDTLPEEAAACPASSPDSLPAPAAAPVYTSLPTDMARRTLQAFCDWRRLPAGTAVSASSAGLFLFPSERWQPPEGTPLDFPDLTESVLTDRETAALFGKTPAAVRKGCESGAFPPWDAKKSAAAWLITRRAACRIYGNAPAKQPPISPLLLVFATAEAALLWGRSPEDVRSAAAGAGHRAARLGDGERRRAGKTWLVTRAAMEKLYGPPIPDAWRRWLET